MDEGTPYAPRAGALVHSPSCSTRTITEQSFSLAQVARRVDQAAEKDGCDWRRPSSRCIAGERARRFLSRRSCGGWRPRWIGRSRSSPLPPIGSGNSSEDVWSQARVPPPQRGQRRPSCRMTSPTSPAALVSWPSCGLVCLSPEGGLWDRLSPSTGRQGVGKSALAVHLAHQVRDRFPDAQLFANLRGQQGEGLDPMVVLQQFLRALGMASEEIPSTPDAAARAYRSRLAGARALIVLDNALNEAQVRPLLPGSPTCAALITSRSPLSGLAEATALTLELLSPADAARVLARAAGNEEIENSDAAEAVAAQCGYFRWRCGSRGLASAPGGPGRSRHWRRSWRTNGTGWNGWRQGTWLFARASP